MRINDASNPEMSLYHDALDMVDADTTTWPISKFIRSANYAMDAVVRKILTVNGRWQWNDSNDTNLSVYTTTLVAGQSDYAIPDGTLIIRRLRATGSDGVLRTLTPMDKRDVTDADIIETGSTHSYDKHGRSIVLYPTPTNGGTLEITIQIGSNHFTVSDTTKEPGFDFIFHRYVALNPARDYAQKYAKDRVQIIDTDIQRLDAEVKEFYAMRDQDEAPFMTVEHSTELY